MELDRVEVGGLGIAYRRAGAGPALLLVHGALGDSRDWRPQLEGLADELTVVAWDAPGCGGSDDPPESFRLPDFADCLAAFAAAIGLERPHVLGLSFGGGLALELYRRHPGLPPERWVRGYLPGMFSESAPPELLEEAAAIMLEVRPAGMRAMARSFAQADLRDVLPGIRVPTLLLYGDADRRSPLGTVAAGLHEKIPGSRLRILPGAGHAANLEVPDRFNAEVREFLSSVP